MNKNKAVFWELLSYGCVTSLIVLFIFALSKIFGEDKLPGEWYLLQIVLFVALVKLKKYSRLLAIHYSPKADND